MKKVNTKFLGLAFAIASVSLLIIACSKSATAPAQNKSLAVHLTDDPGQFTSVFIDIKTVEVKIDTNLAHDSHFADNDKDSDDDLKDQDQYGKWDTLKIRPGVYDIMKLRNGLDTVLAAGNIPVGRIGKIRITLGNNNSVVIANVSKPLNLATGQNKYLYVKIEEDDLDETSFGQLSLWIDFDLASSIEEDNGQYYLKAVLKAFGMERFGRIEGKVLPADAHALVKAYMSSATDTATAIPDNSDGEYKICGLKEGTYNLLFKGYNGYKDTTVKNIQVIKSRETNVAAITLHK
jgi:hypothetical protein